MKRINYKLLIILFAALAVFSNNGYATHLMGGSLSYEYLGDTDSDGDYNYIITFKTYINCNSQFWGGGFPEPSLTIGIYEGPASPPSTMVLSTTLLMPLTDSNYIQLNLPDTCSVGSSVCIYEVVYEAEVDLPLSFSGYHLYYNRCCRNAGIINLQIPNAEGMSFHAYIPPSLVNNSSPVFSDLPVPFLCVNDTQSIINTAFDIDGDQLIFSFVHPYDGIADTLNPAPANPNPLPWPIDLITYKIGYNKNNPFGVGGYAYINGATGYSEYLSPDTGKFVVAVEIKEYRNSQLIGITRRDMQLQIIDCPFNPAPGLSNIGGSGQTSYTIDEGDSLCFPITFTDQFGDSLTMDIAGLIFDTSITNPAATAATPVVGDSVVTSEFCWNTTCGQGQGVPYLFTVSVRDNGCPPKTQDVVYQITVTPFTGPTLITGVTSVCPFDQGLAYSVLNIAGVTYSWTITGGTQTAGGTTNTITVDWDGAGIGIVEVISTNSLGCADGPITLNVTINDYPSADAGIDVFFCSGDTAQLGDTVTLNYIYSWSPTTGLSNPTSSDPTITLTNSGSAPDTLQYIITTTNILTFCELTDTVFVIVYPLPLADAGTDVSFCSGDTAAIGSSAIVGYTYAWTPGTGLSDSTVPDPTISLTNLGSVPDTFIYIVTANDTAPACLTSDTIQIIVNPYPIPNAGPDLAFCSGLSDTLGASSISGYTYLWSPVSGLSDSSIVDPVVTLTNLDTVTDTINYIVETEIFGCIAYDTAEVLVYASPIVDAGPDRYLCSGDVDTIGSTPINGYTYLWNPTTGLSDSTVANPGVTLTNPLISNDTTYYIVTVTTGFACVDADTVRVIVNHLPVSDAGPDTNFCSGDTVALGVATIAGYSYSWNPQNGLSDTSVSNPNISLINLDTIIDTIVYTITTTVGLCSTMDSVRVLVYPLPIVDAGLDIYMCSGDSDTIGSVSYGGYTYLWNPTIGLSDSIASNTEVSLTNPGIPNDTTEYIVTVTTTFQCVNRDSVLVIVNHLPVSDAGPDTSFCSGDTAALGVSNISGYNYNWNPGTGLSDSTVSDPSITLINVDTIIDTLMYYVTTTVDSCATVDSVQVIVYPLPIVDAGSDLYICSGDADTIGSASIGGYIYLWTPGTGLSDSTVSNPEVTLTNPSIPNDTLMYIVTVTTGFLCVDADTVIVVVNHLPVSEAGADVSFCSGSSDSLGASNTPGYLYLWNPTTGLSDSTASNPQVTLLNADTISDTIMYYVTTTVDSCATMDSVQVIVFPLPVSDAGSDIAFCSGDTVTIGTTPKSNLIYSWSPDTGLSDTSISNPTVTLLNSDSIADTIFYVVVTIDTTTACVSSDTVRVIVYSLPVTPEIFGSISVCPGVDSVSYWVEGDSGSTFDWSLVGNGTIIFGQGTDSILVNWDTTFLWTLTAIATDSNGCLGDSSTMNGKTNVFLEPPVPEGPDTLCDDSLTGIVYDMIFTNGSVYAWDIIGGTITAGNGSNSVTVNWDSTGFIWYDETSTTIDTVCTGTSDTLFVSIFEAPAATSIAGNMAVCESPAPESYSIAGLPGSSYTWYVDGDTIANGIGLDTISYVWDTVGVYEISVTETAIGNCIQTLIDTVTVYQKPTANSIIGDTAICFNMGDSFLYYINGFSGSTYQWTVIGGTIISTPLNDDSVTVRWDSVVTGLISVIETSSDSCVGDTLFLSIDVFQVPQETAINGGFVFCEDTAQTMYWVGSLPGSMVTWLLDADTIISAIGADTIYLVWDTAGTYLITVIEVTANGCSDTLIDTVTVFQKPPTLFISGDTAICFDSNDTYLYHVSGFSGSTYNWVVINGQIVSVPIDNDSIIVSWDSLGPGFIIVVETSQDSCVGDSIALNIQINEVPYTDSITGIFELCQFSPGYSYSLNGFGSSTYLWNVPGASNVIDDSSNTITVDWDSAGTFTMSVVEISSAGCVGDTIDSTVTIFPYPQTVTMAGDTNICPPNNLAQLYSVIGFDSSTYVWTVTGGNIDTGQGTNSILVNWDTVGLGVVTVVEISKDSCWGDTIGWFSILLDSPGMLLEVVTDGEINDEEIEIKWSVINSIGFPDSVTIMKRLHFTNNAWIMLAKIPALNQLYIDQAVVTDAFTYEYQITGLNACLNTVASDVHSSILLKGAKNESANSINLVWNKYIGWKQGVQRYEVWRKLDDESSYTFYIDAGLDTAITLKSGKDGFRHCYRVLAHEDFGNQEMSWSNELCVEFEHLLMIPNVITPNGNGWNDTWHIENIEFYKNCIVEIYNRWGMRIFSSVGYPVEWDGTYNGKDLPVGVYYYVIDIFVEDVEPYTGSVSILHRGK